SVSGAPRDLCRNPYHAPTPNSSTATAGMTIRYHGYLGRFLTRRTKVPLDDGNDIPMCSSNHCSSCGRPLVASLVCGLAAVLACGLLHAASAAQKKKKEEITQTLQLPKDLPGTVIGDTHRLTFFVTPLSARGLLSAQVRDGLRALSREA